MKHCQTLLFLVTVVWCWSARSDANACSVVMGYIRPTNYELVREADAIVLANAVTFEKKGDIRDGKSFGIFKFKIVESIKGGFKDEFISIEGDNDIRLW